MAIISIVIAGIVFVFILGILVLVHEFGHFLMAKRNGVRVEEFGFGLPPKVWSKKVGETEYSLNLLPIGGFVRLTGEDTEEENVNDPRNFASKGKLARATILLAGVTMNFLLAFVLYTIFLAIMGFKVEVPEIIPFHFPFGNQREEVFISDVSKDSPAMSVNLSSGDKILAIDGNQVISMDGFKSYVSKNLGKEITLSVQNDKGNRIVKTTPRQNPPKDQGALGVSLGTLTVLSYDTPLQRIFSGVLHSVNIIEYTYKIFGRLINVSVETKNIEPVAQGVSGPVGIFFLVKSVIGIGGEKAILGIIELMALLSLSLGLMNALPFPALDGGRVLFIGIEALIGRKVKPVVERWIHTIGFVILLGLVLLITLKDLFHRF